MHLRTFCSSSFFLLLFLSLARVLLQRSFAIGQCYAAVAAAQCAHSVSVSSLVTRTLVASIVELILFPFDFTIFFSFPLLARRALNAFVVCLVVCAKYINRNTCGKQKKHDDDDDDDGNAFICFGFNLCDLAQNTQSAHKTT